MIPRLFFIPRKTWICLTFFFFKLDPCIRYIRSFVSPTNPCGIEKFAKRIRNFAYNQSPIIIHQDNMNYLHIRLKQGKIWLRKQSELNHNLNHLMKKIIISDWINKKHHTWNICNKQIWEKILIRNEVSLLNNIFKVNFSGEFSLWLWQRNQLLE